MEGGEGGSFFGAGYGRLLGKWEKGRQKGGSVPFPVAFSVWDVLGKWFQHSKAIVY